MKQETEVVQAKTTSNQFDNDDSRLKASPLARAMAKEAGIDLGLIQGSGTDGRIIKKDVESAMEEGYKPSETEATPVLYTISSVAPDEAPIEIPVSQMRKTIARRLGESKFGAPHFYLTIEINMDRAVEARNSVKETTDIKVSLTI